MTDIDTSRVDQLSDAIYRASGMVLGYSATAALRDAGFVTPDDHRDLLAERIFLLVENAKLREQVEEYMIEVSDLEREVGNAEWNFNRAAEMKETADLKCAALVADRDEWRRLLDSTLTDTAAELGCVPTGRARMSPWPPRCATCCHWLPDNPSYPACAIVNHKPDAGALAFMPANADDQCFRHEVCAVIEQEPKA